MALSISRLRTWFVVLALAMVAVVAGFYVRARIELRRTLRNLPGKVGVGIQQTSQGFTFSKSEGGRTLFTIHASKATQFKQGGRAALHDVRIVVYSRHSDRVDQIYGSDFEYDPGSNIVSSAGEVQMDLQGRKSAGHNEPAPQAKASDGSAPAAPLQPKDDLNGPLEAGEGAIHLRAEGLVFDQKHGIAESQGRVEFRLPQAEGTARGAAYDSKKAELVLRSDIDVRTHGAQAAHIVARSGTIAKEPRQMTLEGAQIAGEGRGLSAGHAVAYFDDANALQRVEAEGDVHLSDAGRILLADRAVAHLGPDNAIERLEAAGNVRLNGDGGLQLRAPKAELVLGTRGAVKNVVESAWFGGGVDFDSGAQGAAGHAGEMRMLFAPGTAKAAGAHGAAVELRTILASQGVVLHQMPHEGGRNAQASTLTANAMTLAVSPGSHVNPASRTALRLSSAETEGPGELTMTRAAAGSAGAAATTGQTVIKAQQFKADFGEDNRLRTLRGKGGVQVVSRTAGDPEKVSTSETLMAEFGPAGELTRAVQEGDFRYREQQSSKGEPGGRTATATRAVYSQADDTLALTGTLSGEPRIVDGGTTIEADNIRLLRRTGESFANGNVKTTYAQLTAQPNGALLATSEPVHVTARAMTAHQSPAVAHYTGGARLWQGSNVVQAQNIDFDEKARTIVATGDAQHPVTCVFMQNDAKGKTTTMLVTAPRLSYDDNQRQAHYSGGVTAKSAEGVLTAGRADIVLSPANKSGRGNAPGPSQLERIVASTHVVVQQGARRVEGDKLVYEAANGVYIMSGGAPTLSDPVNGTVRGDSLTFYSRDDRVVVEGGESSRAVTHTHISR